MASITAILGTDKIGASRVTINDNFTALNNELTTTTASVATKVTANAGIAAATKTKVTYDTKGLITAGADATTADIADSLNRRYVTDAQLSVLSATSGTNTGDQSSIVGISGTKSQFDSAVTDGDFLFAGDITQYSDELAQDAVGSILAGTSTVSFSYNDTTPSISADVIDGSITNAKLANVATTTFKGRVSAGTGAVEDLTATQATSLLNNFTDSLKGLAPASGGGTANFLRADGTWAAPPAGGSIALNDLTDVTIASAATGDILIDSGGGAYVNSQELKNARGQSASLVTRLDLLSKLGGANGGYVSGRYYDGANYGLGRGTLAGAVDRIDLAPLKVIEQVTVDRFAVSVSTGVASALGKIIIYSADSNGWPDALLFESGNLDFSSSGERFGASSLTLYPDLIYWFGAWHSSTATLRAYPIGSAQNLGLGTNSASTTYGHIIRRTLTFGAAPSPWVFSSSEISNNVSPVSVMFRKA